jgi:hypothetical protein
MLAWAKRWGDCWWPVPEGRARAASQPVPTRRRAADLLPAAGGRGWVGEREIELLHGVGVAVVHNPVANMILGSASAR